MWNQNSRIALGERSISWFDTGLSSLSLKESLLLQSAVCRDFLVSLSRIPRLILNSWTCCHRYDALFWI